MVKYKVIVQEFDTIGEAEQFLDDLSTKKWRIENIRVTELLPSKGVRIEGVLSKEDY